MTSDSPLAKLPIFDRLTDAELRKILKVGTEVNVPANWSLISERTPADKAYIVVEGDLSVRKGGQEVARLGPGDVVGETAIVTHRLRNASVVSLTASRVVHFTREAVQQLYDTIPTFKEALDVAASGRSGSGSGSGDAAMSD